MADISRFEKFILHFLEADVEPIAKYSLLILVRGPGDYVPPWYGDRWLSNGRAMWSRNLAENSYETIRQVDSSWHVTVKWSQIKLNVIKLTAVNLRSL